MNPIDFQLRELRALVHTAMNCLPRSGPVTICTGPCGFSITHSLQNLTISEGIDVFTTDSTSIVSVTQKGGALNESAPRQSPSLYHTAGSISPLTLKGTPRAGRFLRLALAWILEDLKTSCPDNENSGRTVSKTSTRIYRGYW